MCNINILAVIVSTIVYMVLGMLWYGPLFGKKWMQLTGKKDAMKGPKKEMQKSMVMGLVNAFIIVFVLAIVLRIAGAMSPVAGLMLGALIAIGFVMTVNLNRVLWEKIPIRLFWLNTLHALVSLMIIGAILGAWV
jgi:hypothetical protein